MNGKHLRIFFCFSDFDVMVIEPQFVAEEGYHFLLILAVQQLKHTQLLHFNVFNLKVSLELLYYRLFAV